jgi:hypothetical protein
VTALSRYFAAIDEAQTTFPNMAEVLPEAQIGDARVRHFTWGRIKATRELYARQQPVLPGTFAQLCVRERWSRTGRKRWMGYMNDTLFERISSLQFVRRANGDVLIAGLGLGMVLFPVCVKAGVRSVLVVEKSPDVIALVSPHLTIVQGDIHQWRPDEGRRFDTIFWDILPCYWSTSDFLEICARVREIWQPYLNTENPAAWLGVWAEEEARAEMGLDGEEVAK